MDELELHRLRLKKKHENSIAKEKKPTKEKNKLSNAFTRVLIAAIFVLTSLIYIHLDTSNAENYKKMLFETNLSFTEFDQWYEKKFGKVLPVEIAPPTVPVSKTTNEFKSVTKYENGVACKTTKGSTISTLNSGILVFLGEKEKYGNVAIIQGIDGVDIWYGNIENISLSLYDYVEKDTLLGTSKEEDIYLVFQKDGQFLDYEEYKKQI